MVKNKDTIQINNFRVRFEALKNKSRYARLFKLFNTSRNYYLLNTGTGKVLQINSITYEILDILRKYNDFDEILNSSIDRNVILSNLDNLLKIIDREHLLQAPIIKEMKNYQYNDISGAFNEVQQLQLEVTEKCNLRCKYCIYHEDQGGYRTFGNKFMSQKVAKKAIDFLYVHSQDEVFVSFYGGEPLLNFELIKYVVDYSTKLFHDRIISFNMTTNATLITKEIADYLASCSDFYITVSLDGPQQINDSNRVYINNTGSYNQAIQGIHNLASSYKNRFSSMISINSVITSLDPKDYDDLQAYFENNKLLRKLEKTYSYVSTESPERDYIPVDSLEYDMLLKHIYSDEYNIPDPITKWCYDNLTSKNNIKDTSLFNKDAILKELHLIHNRKMSDKPITFHSINGCCIPGNRRLYVTTEGNLLVCERLGPSPIIGDIYHGIDKKNIMTHYIDEFTQEILPYCNDCWAVNICNLCYINCYDEYGVNIKKRHTSCINNREIILQYLQIYHEILETNPSSLNFLNSYKTF